MTFNGHFTLNYSLSLRSSRCTYLLIRTAPWWHLWTRNLHVPVNSSAVTVGQLASSLLLLVNDSQHLAGGSWRRRTAATAARPPRSSQRWESCLGKIAEVVSRCLPLGFYFRVSFSWIVGCSSIIDTSMQGSCQRQPCCRHGDPGTLQCVGCLTRRLRGNIPHVESTNLF